MTLQVDILQDADAVRDFVTNSWRPAQFSKDGQLAYDHRGKLITNAFLNQEEWTRIDSAVIMRAQQRLGAFGDVLSAGLLQTTTLAEEYSKWKVASERIAADVTMDFRTRVDEDRTERKTYGVPLPIISTKFSFGRRELIVARASGSQIDTTEAEAAAQAVAEMAEVILFDGSTVAIQGNPIYGYENVAGNYDGTAEGDFGTLSNIYPTFTAMVTVMSGRRFYGPWNVYISPTQYFQMLAYYSDGSNQTALQRVLSIPSIRSVVPNDLVAAGEFVAAQLTSDVVDIKQAMPIQTRRWESPDGSGVNYCVMMAATPRIKTDYAGYSGVAYYTGC